MARQKKQLPPDFLNPLQNWRHAHFIPLFDIMLESDNYKALSFPARSLLIYLYSKYNGINKEFTASYNELVKAGYQRSCIKAYIRELWLNGFIDIINKGGNHNKAIYKYSNRWYTDKPP